MWRGRPCQAQGVDGHGAVERGVGVLARQSALVDQHADELGVLGAGEHDRGQVQAGAELGAGVSDAGDGLDGGAGGVPGSGRLGGGDFGGDDSPCDRVDVADDDVAQAGQGLVDDGDALAGDLLVRDVGGDAPLDGAGGGDLSGGQDRLGVLRARCDGLGGVGGEDLLAGLVEDSSAGGIEAAGEQEVRDETHLGDVCQALGDQLRLGEQDVDLLRGQCLVGVGNGVGVGAHETSLFPFSVESDLDDVVGLCGGG